MNLNYPDYTVTVTVVANVAIAYSAKIFTEESLDKT